MGRLFISQIRNLVCALVLLGVCGSPAWAEGIDGYGPDALKPDAESIAVVAKAVEEVSRLLLDAKERLVILSVEGRDTRRVAREIVVLEEVLLNHTREFSEMVQVVADAGDGEIPVWLKGTMAVVLKEQGLVSDPDFSVKKRRRSLHADLATQIGTTLNLWFT